MSGELPKVMPDSTRLRGCASAVNETSGLAPARQDPSISPNPVSSKNWLEVPAWRSILCWIKLPVPWTKPLAAIPPRRPELPALVAVVAVSAVLACVALSAVAACVALGTVPSVEALICLPVSEPAATFDAVTAPVARFAFLICPRPIFLLVIEPFLMSDPLIRPAAHAGPPSVVNSKAPAITRAAGSGLNSLIASSPDDVSYRWHATDDSEKSQ
jgi:hypothetical protein